MDNNLKIRRVSALLRLGCNVYLVLTPVLVVAIWLNLDSLAGELNPQFAQPLRMEFIGPVNLVLGFLVSSIPKGLMMYGVWRLRELFGLYRIGTFFTPTNAGHLHAFALILLITVVSSPVIDILQSLVLTMNYPEGERSISINFSTDDLSTLFLAGVMFAIAWTMREGHRLAEENAEFV